MPYSSCIQITQTPAHHPIKVRNWPGSNNPDQSLALGGVQSGRRTGRFAINQAVWASGVEPQYPIANSLNADISVPRRYRTRSLIIDQGKRQQPPRLFRDR
jgi:hypothetical protein